MKQIVIGLLIAEELAGANQKFPPFASTHEGYAVIQEEIEETIEEVNEIFNENAALFRQIKESHKCDDLKEDHIVEMRKAAVRGIEELIQVAAMCDKFMAIKPKEETK